MKSLFVAFLAVGRPYRYSAARAGAASTTGTKLGSEELLPSPLPLQAPKKTKQTIKEKRTFISYLARFDVSLKLNNINYIETLTLTCFLFSNYFDGCCALRYPKSLFNLEQ
jgi:hypothetical protein